MTALKFVSHEEARQITGHRSLCAFQCWLKRWNKIHTDAPISRLNGRVELYSLTRALENNISTRVVKQ